MTRPRRAMPPRPVRRRGTVLMVVMVLCMLAGLVLATMLYQTGADAAAEAVADQRRQAYYAAVSGVTYAGQLLQRYRDEPDFWRDNPDLFEARSLNADQAGRWRFTVWSPPEVRGDRDEPTALRYGPSSEAARLHLATLDANRVAALDALTAEQADALLDYLDRDDSPRPNGAEQDYYSALPYPYVIRNGPPGTVGELLLVRGFSAETLYGEDYNRNGLLDPAEDDGSESFPPDDADGQLARGLAGLLTVYSYDPDTDEQGRAKVDINKASRDTLRRAGLDDQAARFVELVRKEGVRFKHPVDLLEMRHKLRKPPREDRRRRRRRPRRVNGLEVDRQGYVASGVGVDQIGEVLARFTAQSGPKIGRVDIRVAPAEVLRALPGLDEQRAERIVSARGGDLSAGGDIAWLLEGNLLDIEAFKELAPHITARSYQFRLNCYGYGVDAQGRPSGAYCGLEAVLDLAGDRPRVLYLCRTTPRGAPVSLDARPEDR